MPGEDPSEHSQPPQASIGSGLVEEDVGPPVPLSLHKSKGGQWMVSRNIENEYKISFYTEVSPTFKDQTVSSGCTQA